MIVENPVHGYRFLLTRADGGHAWLNASGVHPIETLDSEDVKRVTFASPRSGRGRP
ncbi:hypothetical protein [Cryobacterium sp. GrIS_2_6]|uniref:hypothetical protein n=1 Tax=Cryobacterium sp. GrIS_2_6 TaxID=3162785 RepID=UPI002E0A1749|nr:hypothetical protein [Cryobacterium psychrotolerans]